MPCILIVDDERGIRSLLSTHFTRAGYRVSLAADAFQAMALCDSNPFDVVLADIDMPRMDGHELMRWIAVKHPRIVCVLMTGCGIECSECPFADRCPILGKPFLPQQAVSLITELLGKRPD